MTNRDDFVYFQHVLESILRIDEDTKGIIKNDFKNNYLNWKNYLRKNLIVF